MVNIGKDKTGAHFTIFSLFHRISVFQNMKLGERKKKIQLRNASKQLGWGKATIIFEGSAVSS